MGDVVVGLLLDFWVGVVVMGFWVVVIGELVEDFVVVFVLQFVGQIVCVFYVFFFVDQNEFGVIGGYCCFVFGCGVVWYDQDYFVIFDCCCYGQGDVGVVGSSFDQCIVGVDVVVQFGMGDY